MILKVGDTVEVVKEGFPTPFHKGSVHTIVQVSQSNSGACYWVGSYMYFFAHEIKATNVNTKQQYIAYKHSNKLIRG